MKKIFIFFLAFMLLMPYSAFADFAPVSDTPYGIPLYNSPEDVDLSIVLEGNGKDRLLDQLGVFRVTSNHKQSGSYDSESVVDCFYVKENIHPEHMGQYFCYQVNNYSDNSTGSSLVSYDPDEPFFNQFCTDGSRNDSKLEPGEENTIVLKRPAAFNITPSQYTFEITNSKVKNGMFYIEFNITPLSADSKYDYSDCSILIDPDTSLICEYAYKYYYAKRDITVEDNGVLDYNINADEIPDYSILF